MSLATNIHYQLTDTWAITRRNLIRYIRLPQLLFFSSVQPIMFLILFNYVFGGAINTAATGGKYIDFFLPGIMTQMILFGAIQTGIGLAEDMSKGIIDRFRSLPMSRAAVMSGRTLSDSIRNVVVSLIMLSVAMLIGFRFHNGILSAVAMVGIIVLFGFAFSWFAAIMGLNAKDAETAQLSSFLFIFPLIFASSAYVPVSTMPSWLQIFARNQPITQVVNAARQLALGVVPPGTEGAIWKTFVWIGVMLAVFVPIAIWQYRRR